MPSKDDRSARLRDFEALVGALEAPLLHYATRILNNSAHAEDVVQEALVKFVRCWKGEFVASPEVSAWLYRTVHNEAVDLIRAEERRRKLHREHGDEAMAQPPEPDAGPNGEPAEPGEDALAAAQALETLSSRERQAVVLKVYEGKRYREIAEIMGVSVDNVGVTLHAAMRKLAAALEGRRAR